MYTIAPGMYSTGRSGARDYGLKHCRSEYYWQIDSDNFIVETTALRDLMRPFAEDKEVCLSVPIVITSPEFPAICNWLALEEHAKLEGILSEGRAQDGWILIRDLPFGIGNATVLKVSALKAVGGYDSDVRVLSRLRRSGLSCSALVPSSHYLHLSIDGPRELVHKIRSRVRRFGRMSSDELENYFVDHTADRGTLSGQASVSVIGAPYRAITHVLRRDPREWGWGLAYPLLVGYAALSSPVNSLRTFYQFF